MFAIKPGRTGHSVQGSLKVLKEKMLGLQDRSSPKVFWIMCFVCVNKCSAHAKKARSKAQSTMRQRFVETAVARSFTVSDKVLVLFPIPGPVLSTPFVRLITLLKNPIERDKSTSVCSRHTIQGRRHNLSSRRGTQGL